jgi:hypothetical protein
MTCTCVYNTPTLHCIHKIILKRQNASCYALALSPCHPYPISCFLVTAISGKETSRHGSSSSRRSWSLIYGADLSQICTTVVSKAPSTTVDRWSIALPTQTGNAFKSSYFKYLGISINYEILHNKEWKLVEYRFEWKLACWVGKMLTYENLLMLINVSFVWSIFIKYSHGNENIWLLLITFILAK